MGKRHGKIRFGTCQDCPKIEMPPVKLSKLQAILTFAQHEMGLAVNYIESRRSSKFKEKCRLHVRLEKSVQKELKTVFLQ
jgi:hypothetical protein